jgi:hypothetical protein
MTRDLRATQRDVLAALNALGFATTPDALKPLRLIDFKKLVDVHESRRALSLRYVRSESRRRDQEPPSACPRPRAGHGRRRATGTARFGQCRCEGKRTDFCRT